MSVKIIRNKATQVSEGVSTSRLLLPTATLERRHLVLYGDAVIQSTDICFAKRSTASLSSSLTRRRSK